MSWVMVFVLWFPLTFRLLKGESARWQYAVLIALAVLTLSMNWQGAFHRTSKLESVFGEPVVLQGVVIDMDFGYENRITISSDYISVKDDKGGYRTYNVDEKLEIVLIGNPEPESVGVGREIRFETVLESLEGKRNPGGFDRRLYRRIDGVMATGHTEISTVEYLGVRPFYDMIWRFKQDAVNRIALAVDEDYLAYGVGMITGEKGGMSASQRELVLTSGLSHVFAVSGLHFGILYMFLFAFLCRLELARPIKIGIIAFSILFYTLLLWGKVSVIRAAAMLTVMIIANSIGRKYDPLSALSLISIVLLVFNPLIVFSVAYQLSFIAVITIFTYGKVMGRLRKNHDLKWGVLALIIGGLLFQVTLQPLLAYHFNVVSTLSLFSNALTASTVALLIPLLVMIAVFGGFYPVQLIGGHIANVLLSILHHYMLMVKAIPFALVEVPSPDIRVLIAYYVVLGLIALLFNVWDVKAFGWAFVQTLVVVALCMILSEPQGMTLYYLDVGQGDGILIEAEGGKRVLIDTGPEWAYYDLKKALLRLGIREIDLLVLTHNHNDHDGNLRDLLSDFKVHNILIHDDYPVASESGDVRVAERSDILVAEPGLFVELDDNTGLEVLYSGEGISDDNENNRSVVLELTYHSSRYLFTGDIEGDGERYMSESLNFDRYDIIKVPHHGSDTSSTDSLLNAADFDYAIVQCGNNFYGLPKADVLTRYEMRGSRIMSTKEHGCIVVRDEKGNIKINGFIE